MTNKKCTCVQLHETKLQIYPFLHLCVCVCNSQRMFSALHWDSDFGTLHSLSTCLECWFSHSPQYQGTHWSLVASEMPHRTQPKHDRLRICLKSKIHETIKSQTNFSPGGVHTLELWQTGSWVGNVHAKVCEVSRFNFQLGFKFPQFCQRVLHQWELWRRTCTYIITMTYHSHYKER